MAYGNQHADAVARGAAAATQSPTPQQIQDWCMQVGFLNRYLQYVPQVLARWPKLGPTEGKRSLPKRPGAAKRARRASFDFDVLGVLETPGGSGEGSKDPSEAPFPEGPPEIPGSTGPPEGPTSTGPSEADAPKRHEWHWQDGRWLCVA